MIPIISLVYSTLYGNIRQYRWKRLYFQDKSRGECNRPVNPACALTFRTNMLKLSTAKCSLRHLVHFAGRYYRMKIRLGNFPCRDALCTIGFLRSYGLRLPARMNSVRWPTGLVFARQFLLFVLVWNKDSGFRIGGSMLPVRTPLRRGENLLLFFCSFSLGLFSLYLSLFASVWFSDSFGPMRWEHVRWSHL